MKIESEPFDWNDKMAENAIEDFNIYRDKMTYCDAQEVGLALAKLKLLEEQGAKVVDE